MASGKLGDPELEAFFLAGEKGTYEGGPAHSLSPVAVALPEDEHEEPGPRLTAEQIARRERFRRKVTLLVSALGLASGLALTVRLVRSPEESLPALPEVAAPETTRAGNVGADLASKDSPAPEPSSEAEAHSVSVPSSRAPVAPRGRSATEPVPAARDAAAVAKAAPARTPSVLSAVRRVSATVEHRPDGYAPPTASFPD